jgi:ureidoglycolate lyase
MDGAIRYVQVEALTALAYEPFGSVIGLPSEPPVAENEERSYWKSPDLELVEGTFKPVYVEMRRIDYVVRRLHRHRGFSQVLIPLGGEAFIHVVAPPGDVPDLSQLRAFIVEGDKGVIIGRGTWHRNPAYPLSTKASLVLISGGPSSRDQLTRGEQTVSSSTDLVELSSLSDDEFRLLL